MSSDDWANFKPKDVNINKLFRNNPKHRYCHMCIHASPKNPTYIGLYCKEHNHHYTWINEEQFIFLTNLGIEAI